MTDPSLTALVNITAWLLIAAALLVGVRSSRRRMMRPGAQLCAGDVRSHRSWRLARRPEAAACQATPAPGPDVPSQRVRGVRAPRRARLVSSSPTAPDNSRHLDDRGVRRLGAVLAERDRLRPAEDALPALIGQLDPEKWMAVWDFPVTGGQALVVLLGPNGAFVLAAGNGGFTPDDAARLTTAANGI